jgi:hypothetical protein
MTLKLMRRAGAMAILLTGGVHLQQYLGDYQSIPTIGPPFLLNAIGSAVVGVGLLIPLERRLGSARGDLVVGLLALVALSRVARGPSAPRRTDALSSSG